MMPAFEHRGRKRRIFLDQKGLCRHFRIAGQQKQKPPRR